MPAKVVSTASLPGLSPVAGKPIIAGFDGGLLSSDGGLLALREIEWRLGIAARVAGCITDPRVLEQVTHQIGEIVRFRMLMIATGYESLPSGRRSRTRGTAMADVLRHDPMFKLAVGRLPEDGALCSQPTISRLENLPDKRTLLRMGYAMVDFYCDSFRHVPRRIVLDVDDTAGAAPWA